MGADVMEGVSYDHGHSLRTRRIATTDSRGRFRLATESEPRSLQFSKQGYVTLTRHVPPAPSMKATLDVRMRTDGTVRLAVQDARGLGIEHIRLRLCQSAGSGFWEGVLSDPVTDSDQDARDLQLDARTWPKSDEAGVSIAKGIAFGAPYDVWVHFDDEESFLMAATAVQFAPGDQERRFVLPPLGAVRGRTTVNGAGRSALLRWSSERGHGMARSNDDGSFSLNRIPAGDVKLKVSFRNPVGERVKQLRVSGGTIESVDVAIEVDRTQLRGSLQMRGRARTQDFVVQAVDPTGFAIVGTVDEHGSFQLSRLSPDTVYRLVASDGPRTITKFRVRPGDAGIVFDFSAEEPVVGSSEPAAGH